MRMVAAACILPLLATPSFAGRCIDLAEAKKLVAKEQARWTALTADQWQFLRGVSAMHPATPKGIPLGSSAAMMAKKGEPGGLIFFIDGKRACDVMPIPEAVAKMVLDVGTGVINHEGDGL